MNAHEIAELEDRTAGDAGVVWDSRVIGPRTPGWSRCEIAFVVALTLFVVVAATWRLGVPSFWNDEAATWGISGHGFADVVNVLRVSDGDRGAALYYAVVHVWVGVFGTTEVAFRSLSVIAAGATIPAFYAVGRRLVARTAATAAAVLLATSPFFLTYARDARTYAVATFMVVLATLAFLRALETGTVADWTVYTLVAAVSVYFHWFAALVVLAQFVSLLSVGPHRIPLRRVITSAAVLTLLMSPIAILVLFGSRGGVEWIAPLSVAGLKSLATRLIGTTDWLGRLLYFMVLVAGSVAAVRIARRNRASPAVNIGALALTWFVVPIGATLAISAFKPVLVPRYLIVALPGFALLLGLGLTYLVRGRSALLAAGVVAFVIVGASGYGPVWSASPYGENWRDITRVIAQRAAPTDAVVVFPASAVFAVSYYAHNQAALDARTGPLWPPVTWDTPFSHVPSDPTSVTAVARASVAVVWLVVREPRGRAAQDPVAGTSALRALQRELLGRFPNHVQIAQFKHDRVVLVRYSAGP